MKRFWYIIGVIAVSLLLVGGMTIAALSSDKVETAAVHLVTAEFSRAFGTEVQVGSVEYRFPARLAIKDIYFEDQQQDTLLYIGEVYAHFSPLALRNNEIRFSHARVNNVVANIYPLNDSTWNYTFLVAPFLNQPQQEEASSPFNSLLSVKDVQLDNIRVRYDQYYINLPHAEMDLNQLTAQTIDAQIEKFEGLKVRKFDSLEPFEVKDLKAHVILNDTMLSVPTLTTQLPHSRLDLSGIEVHADSSVALTFHEALFMPADIALFVPRMKGLKRTISLNGELSGRIDSLYFKDIVIRDNGRTVLQGDISAFGLPDLANPYLRANLTDVHTNAAHLQDFLSQLYQHPIVLPVQVHRLGNIHYRGLAEGRLHDLTLHGAFRTALGAISTDGTFRSDSLFEHMEYDARVVARSFQLGRMMAAPKLGSTTLDLASRGHIDQGELYSDVNAHVRQFTYNNYTYNDLHINGRLEPHRYQGQFNIDDPHLNMDFDGVVDLHDVDPEMNFNLHCYHFDTEPLLASLPKALSKRGVGSESVQTSFSLAVDLNGAKPDDISGYLVMDSLYVATPYDAVLMKQLTMVVTAGPGTRKAITLQSDYLNAQVKGSFRYADIPSAAQAMMHYYLPTAVEKPRKTWQAVELNMQMEGKQITDIERLFASSVVLSDNPTLQLDASIKPGNSLNAQTNDVAFRFSVPVLEAGNRDIHDLNITLNTLDEKEEIQDPLALQVSATVQKMPTTLSAFAFRDSLLTRLVIDTVFIQPETEDLPYPLALVAEQRAGTYGGDISLLTCFDQYKQKPLISVHVLPGTLLLRDSLYTMDESTMVYCAADTTLSVDHFSFAGAGQHLRMHGLASRQETDTLSIDLQRINAAYVVPFVLAEKTIRFNGLLTGRADATAVLRRPQLATKIHIDGMGLNDCPFGDAEVDLHIADSLAFHADVYKVESQKSKDKRQNVVTLDGKALFDGTGTWKLDMMTDSVPLGFVNHWTSNVLRDLDGKATGHVVVGGRIGFTYVLVDARAQDASFTLPWTGARYTIPSDIIRLDTSAIIFPEVHCVDREGHSVIVNGDITHTQFHSFNLNLHVDANEALVFDNNRSGEMLQGHVYATGHVDVTGPDNDILVYANAQTTHNSQFRLSLDNAANAYESSFIHFVNKDTVPQDTKTFRYKHPEDEIPASLLPPSRCVVKLNLDINPFLLFQLVLGERNGDIIQGRGNGALRLTYDTSTGDVSLLGTYDIDQGTLSYTVANVIRKEFTVGAGSTIVFSGDPANPQLDVTAKYRVVANLRDLFGDEAEQLATSRSNIPVLTCMHLSGPLSGPLLSFALEFPSSDQAIQQQVKQIINTDEMLMRQVIYLLVFGRFFTPEYMTNATAATLNSTYSLLSSTVTGQINAWLSKLTTMLTLGVAIRTDGEGSDRSQEYEAQFQLQPVDRLVINGNVGYRYNDVVSNQPFFGDLDVEVLLTEDGQLRLKGYTHTVDKYSLRQASTIQGVGLLWKKDFNWPKRKEKKEK